MEQKAPRANHNISGECEQEYHVVAMFPDIQHPLRTEIKEQQICQGIDEFSDVWGSIVILKRAALFVSFSSDTVI